MKNTILMGLTVALLLFPTSAVLAEDAEILPKETGVLLGEPGAEGA